MRETPCKIIIMHLVRTKNEKEKKNVWMFAARYMKDREAIKRKDIINNLLVTYVSHFTILFFRSTLFLYMEILISHLYNGIAEINIDYK
jgi:hypothetical protein